MRTMVEVARNDLTELCDAVIEGAPEYGNTGPWQSGETRCRHCDQLYKDDWFCEHETDCVVKLAEAIEPQ